MSAAGDGTVADCVSGTPAGRGIGIGTAGIAAVEAVANGTATAGPPTLPAGKGAAVGMPEPARTTGRGGTPPIDTGAAGIGLGTIGAGIEVRGMISVCELAIAGAASPWKIISTWPR